MTYEKTFPLALELRHYRYFHVLAQELHFARAAEKLNISQPALSQQVKWIEAEIGAPLLQRGGRKVGLTKVGLALQEQASSILEQNERAHRHLLAVASGNVGSVDIGFVASAALSGILPRIVYDYRRAYPSTEVRVHEMDMLTQVAAVESGRLDVGFVRPPLPLPESVTLVDVLEEPMCVVLHKDHARAGDAKIFARDLRDDTFICTNRLAGVGLYAITLDICKQAGFEPITEVFSPQVSVLVSMVAAGFGVTLVPQSTRAFLPPDVVFKPLADTVARSRLALVSDRRSTSPTARAFIACTKDWSRAQAKVGGRKTDLR